MWGMQEGNEAWDSLLKTLLFILFPYKAGGGGAMVQGPLDQEIKADELSPVL